MGNSCTCFESGKWDIHPEINKKYVPAKVAVYQDMTQPLSHYFISSGHNSYLTGDQLFASAGTSTIIQCLKAGCRVVELDVYNGPLCKHGGTFTSPVSFKECIEAIGAYAFVASPFPVIITMENHTDTENQAKMAAILREVLGDKLYVPDPEDPMQSYKSPKELQKKILCRTSIKKSGHHEDFLALIYIRNAKFSTALEMIQRDKVASSSFEETAMPQADELGPDNSEKDAEKELTRLLTGDIFKKQYDQKTFGQDPDDAVLPGSATAAGSLQELYTYTSKHLARVYPAMWRVTSGNYNPFGAWIRGASLAALNWQVWDKALWCNEAKFMDNGGCGYVLKPEWMRKPEAKLPAPRPRKLVVRLHSAHRHQGRNCWVFKDDLFVKMTVWGMPVDHASHRTQTVRDTGRLKVEKDFTFAVHYPEMAVLCVQLKDDDSGGIGGAVGSSLDDTLGYYSLPLSTLAEGEFKVLMKKPSATSPTSGRESWVKLGLRWDDDDTGAAEVANPMYSGPGPT